MQSSLVMQKNAIYRCFLLHNLFPMHMYSRQRKLIGSACTKDNLRQENFRWNTVTNRADQGSSTSGKQYYIKIMSETMEAFADTNCIPDSKHRLGYLCFVGDCKRYANPKTKGAKDAGA